MKQHYKNSAKNVTSKMRMVAVAAAFLFSGSFTAFGQTVHKDYEDGRIYLKLKNEIVFDAVTGAYGTMSLDDAYFLSDIRQEFRLESIRKPFFATQSEVLQRTFLVEFSDYQNVDKLIESLSRMSMVEYAEKVPIITFDGTTTAVVPNDPSYSQQWYLKKINAEKAWDYSKGNDKGVIAIVDQGVDLKHEDLSANIWINPKEIAGNNIDDDNNGFIDDINGWDPCDKDNNPNPDAASNNHGTHCAGDAAAVSNNGKGIASIGFGVKIMALKMIGGSNCSANIAYEGITYAADNGARVISNSWGSYSFSQTHQSVIDHANSKGVVVFGTAGNDGQDKMRYPGAYNHVICIANTDQNDKKASSSNFGTWVDLSSPGQSIYSTVPGSKYQSFSGTSMACPIAAGLATLMISLNPAMTPAQVESCLKTSAVNIDGLNASYAGKLGAGRIDAAAAMKCANDLLATSIKKVYAAGEVKLYPNPASGAVTIEGTFDQVEIFNIIGENVYSSAGHTANTLMNISIEHMPAGVYFARIKSENTLYTTKFIKE